MDSTTALQIAVLINSPSFNEFCHAVRQSFSDAFRIVAPAAQVDFYDPVVEGYFPRPQDCDLIVLSGGKADASSSEPWVLKLLDFVRVAARDSPRTQIMGICFGHQTVARAFGGEVAAVSTGPIAAIQDVNLTEVGKKFFPFAANSGYYVHPEFQNDLVKKLLLEEDDVYNGNSSRQQLELEVRKLDQSMDGIDLLRRVIQWVKE
ncbi:copper/iron-regulated glutamine amidotransferase [Lipomyces tetrasporus]|uniref:Copper/iron-regulated glutamine amidotransferase n=1 Tax=Lipomyces tetrasporus TaxID=54092 RepID=A0AAD7QKY7_9ASCO|nr:copper/iron-regulated glutamine amidotransferase [Lipomyces tetrasporus]KAJ8097197.1 copper/iron-regulated glutamine amidotransferase [Lipomyces tetrasporus]